MAFLVRKSDNDVFSMTGVVCTHLSRKSRSCQHVTCASICMPRLAPSVAREDVWTWNRPIASQRTLQYAHQHVMQCAARFESCNAHCEVIGICNLSDRARCYFLHECPQSLQFLRRIFTARFIDKRLDLLYNLPNEGRRTSIVHTLPRRCGKNTISPKESIFTGCAWPACSFAASS